MALCQAARGDTLAKEVEQTAARITGEMTVAEVIELYPEAADVLADWGLGCAMCAIGQVETLAEGAFSHGFSAEQVENLLAELNEAAEEEAAEKAKA